MGKKQRRGSRASGKSSARKYNELRYLKVKKREKRITESEAKNKWRSSLIVDPGQPGSP